MPSSDAKRRGHPWVQGYAAFIERRAALLVVGLLGLTLLLGLAASRLRLRTDFTELLPPDQPSVQALHRLNQRLGGVGTLNIAIETRNLEAAKRFTEDLVRATRRQLGDRIRSIDYTVAPVRRFYQRNGALFLSLRELEDLERGLAEAIREQKLGNNPFYVDLEESRGPSAAQRVRRLVDELERRGRALDRFPQGYYVDPKGQLLGIFMRPHGSALEISAARETLRRMSDLVDELHPERYDPSLRVSLIGTLQITLTEYAAIVRDIVSTAGLCVLLVALVVWAYFRTVRALFLFAVTLAAGAVWAFGLGSLFFGYVNAQTAFLGSIIVGTGINYGIMFVARYQEERRAGASPSEALPLALAATARPTFVAALTTALCFGALGFAQMRSFAQFGFIGGMGMAACWFLSYSLLPAMLTLLERAGRRGPQPSDADQVRIRYPVRLARAPLRWALPILAISGILVAWSVAEVSGFLPHGLESDMNMMRNRGTQNTPLAALDGRLSALFGETLVPAVVLAETREQAAEVCAVMGRVRAREPGNPLVGWCRSVQTFLPDRQPAKLRVIARIRDRLEGTGDLLPAELRRRLDERWGRLPDRLVTLADLPEEIRSRFRERSGAETIVLVAPGEKRELWRMDDLLAFSDVLREIRLPDGKVLHSSGESVIFADLIRTIQHDAPRTTTLAAIAVLLVLAFTLRRTGPVMMVGAALVAGVTVMVGVAAFLGIKYNFFNFVALPTTFGIGVDYPVNVQQRYSEEGPGGVERSLRRTGAAVLVASLTTIIGYAVLLISDSLALASFGSLAIIGEVTCLAAALLMLPALFSLLERRRRARTRDEQPLPSAAS